MIKVKPYPKGRPPKRTKQPSGPSGAGDSAMRLLDAAESVFAELGFDAATTREIAAKAKVNSALIQYHFGGKSRLYEAVLERRFAQVGENFAQATSIVDASEGGRITREVMQVALRTVLRNHLRMAASKPAFHQIMQREQVAGLPVAKKLLLRMLPLDPVARLFERAQEAGIVRKDLHPLFITSILFGVHQHCLAGSPMMKELIGLDLSQPDHIARLVDMNLRFLFEGLWEPSR